MGFFDLGRKEGYPSQYPSPKTAVTVDVLDCGLILAFVILGVAFLTVILASGLKKSANSAIKVICSLTIGGCLIVANFGQEWEVGRVQNTKAVYRAGSPHEINATVGIKLGLRSINVTLKGYGFPTTPLENETINYNERFWWTWDQGRFGFGPYAGSIQQSFRKAQRTGLPIPILSVVEYFVIDGEGWRFGRFYRTAGWYTHICMWTAFATWIISNIFLQSVVCYSAHYLALTGGLQLLACVVWAAVRNPYPLVIPFEAGKITTSYGVHYWTTLICGIFCILLATLMLYLDLRYPVVLSNFLRLDVSHDCVLESDSIKKQHQPSGRWTGRHVNEIQMQNLDENSIFRENQSMTIMRKRSTLRKAQKKLFRRLGSTMTADNPSEEETIFERQINRPGPSSLMQRDVSESKEHLCSTSKLSKKKNVPSMV